ncbi:MAG: M23 family metallopeptidase [Leptospirales bacterium]|nr:M23 family metallopeptidase [Leptospirales bacterium]
MAEAANGPKNKFNVTYKIIYNNIHQCQWLSPYMTIDDGSIAAPALKKAKIYPKDYYLWNIWLPVNLSVWEKDIGLSVKTSNIPKNKNAEIEAEIYYTDVDKKNYTYYKSFTGKVKDNDVYLIIKIRDVRIIKLSKNTDKKDFYFHLKLFVDGELRDEKNFRGDDERKLRIEPLDTNDLFHFGEKPNIGTMPFYRYQFGLDPKRKELLTPKQQKYGLVRLNCPFMCTCETHNGKHDGIDIPTAAGTPVLAVASGTVHEVKDYGPNKDYGRYIAIRHGNDLETRYGHNLEICVKKHQKVKRGQIIAKAGNTGNSYGTHVHYEVRNLKKDSIAEKPIEAKFAEEKIIKETYQHFDGRVVGDGGNY